jgi:acetolactate synthase-1/2/3 large subunit
MSNALRGADIVARSLEQAGVSKVFTLSGNHIMSIFDAALETKLELIHVRHEAAAVHMADAWGRLTGAPGIAMVTGGPGHANAVGALYTALCAEAPMVLLSGHAMTSELGRGGFQEIRQADMAAPVSKASWTSKSAATLGRDMAEAMRIAASGRPGPVHVSLPSDLLDETVEANAIAWPDAGASKPTLPIALAQGAASTILAALAAAKRPLIMAGPQLANAGRRTLVEKLEAATGVPCIIGESVRGVRDATLGAFADVLKRADLLVLIGKPLDFTLQWATPPTVDANCRLIVVDPEGALLERAGREKGTALSLACLADPFVAITTLIEQSAGKAQGDPGWRKEARTAVESRPESWASLKSKTAGRLHPAEVFRTLRPMIERDPSTILVCDGGEFSQWGQSMLPVSPRRMINSVAGAIGSGLPCAIAARAHDPKAPILAVLGDGTFGFHMSEFETAVRHNLPFVAILGNDACWNAESQIQLRDYGRERMHGCALLPARYDKVVEALGGHGELVDKPEALSGAVERALASGKPACINIMTESIAAPTLRALA